MSSSIELEKEVRSFTLQNPGKPESEEISAYWLQDPAICKLGELIKVDETCFKSRFFEADFIKYAKIIKKGQTYTIVNVKESSSRPLSAAPLGNFEVSLAPFSRPSSSLQQVSKEKSEEKKDFMEVDWEESSSSREISVCSHDTSAKDTSELSQEPLSPSPNPSSPSGGAAIERTSSNSFLAKREEESDLQERGNSSTLFSSGWGASIINSMRSRTPTPSSTPPSPGVQQMVPPSPNLTSSLPSPATLQFGCPPMRSHAQDSQGDHPVPLHPIPRRNSKKQ